MKRRVLSLVLALCMAVGMAGCGSSEKEKSGKSASAEGDRKQISMWFWGCATPLSGTHAEGIGGQLQRVTG